MNFNKHIAITTAILTFCFILFGGIGWYFDYTKTQKLLWQEVEAQGQLATYQEYIKTNPKYKQQALKKIAEFQQDKLSFDNAIFAQTELGLVEYLKTCAKCDYKNVVEETIASIQALGKTFYTHLNDADLSKGENGYALYDIEQLQLIVPKAEKIKSWTVKVAEKYQQLAGQALDNNNINFSKQLLKTSKQLLVENNLQDYQNTEKNITSELTTLAQMKTALINLEQLVNDYHQCFGDCPEYINRNQVKISQYKIIKKTFKAKVAKQQLTSASKEIIRLRKISKNSQQIKEWQLIIADEFYQLAKTESPKTALLYINKGLKLAPNHNDLLKLKRNVKSFFSDQQVFEQAKTAGTLQAMQNYLNNCNNDCSGIDDAETMVFKTKKIIKQFNKNIKKNNLLYGRSGFALKDLENLKKIFPKDTKIATWEKQILKSIISTIKNKIERKQYKSARRELKQVLKVYKKNKQIKILARLLNFKNKAKNSSVVPQMVYVSGGGFTMGGKLRYSNPKRWVSLKPFKISKTEVTFNAFSGYARNKRLKIGSNSWGKNNRPVINISWHQAVDFTRWLSDKTNRNFRLPTEAEWEFVAKQSAPLLSSTRMNKSIICRYANGADITTKLPWKNRQCNDGFSEKTAPVKSFMPNKLGIYDMHGNVWEWTLDCWHYNFVGAPKDNTPRDNPANCRRKVIKGGGWNSSVIAMLPGHRSSAIKNLEYNYIGFRIVEDI